MMGFDAPGMLAPAFLPEAFVSPQNIATLRLASAAFYSAANDTPARAYYEPRILDDIEIGQSAADALAVGGRVALTVSEIALADGDNFAADLARYGLADGRAVRVLSLPVVNARASDFGASLASAAIPFVGVLRSIDRTGEFSARLALGDVTERMATPLQPVLYQGTGGAEGGSELKGRPKPVTLGQVFNIAPVFLGNVDLGAGSLPTYQSHWREMAGHDVIRIRGVAQSIISTGTPLIGQARDYPALGLFQLGAAPDGDVTADLRGDSVPIYVNSIAAILRRMLESLGLAYDPVDFDTTAWAFAEADLPGIVGFHQGATATTTLAAAEQILSGSGAILAAGRGGKLRLADPLASDAPQFDLPAECVLACEPLALPASLRPLPRAIAVRWGLNHAPLSNMAGSVAAADRQRLSQAGSFARAESSLITSRVAQQREMTFPATYWTEAEALVRAEKWRALLEAGPRMVRVLTDRFLGQIEIGQIGRVTYPAFGFQNGFVGVVVGWRERLSARRVEITLWGAG
ncbi:MAG: hypothetical protein IOD03_19365 [Methylocystis sp.]|nr:hypothetical protein [Methylocystis sp.]